MKSTEAKAIELFRTMGLVRKAWHNVTPCETLNKSQFGTLMMIAHRGQPPGQPCADVQTPDCISLSTLASVMHQSLPALSQRVSALEALGYVERVPDPDDRRVIGLRVTPEGMRVLNIAYERFNRILTQSIGHLGTENFDTLVTLMGELAVALEQAVAAQNEKRESEDSCSN